MVDVGAWFTGPDWRRAIQRGVRREFVLTKLQALSGFREAWMELFPVGSVLPAKIKQIDPADITSDQWRTLLDRAGISPHHARGVLLHLGLTRPPAAHHYSCGLNAGKDGICTCGTE